MFLKRKRTGEGGELESGIGRTGACRRRGAPMVGRHGCGGGGMHEWTAGESETRQRAIRAGGMRLGLQASVLEDGRMEPRRTDGVTGTWLGLVDGSDGGTAARMPRE